MKFYDDIADYKANRLSLEEKLSFENAMKKDEDLRLAVKHFEVGAVVLDELKKEQIRDEISQAINASSSTTTDGSRNWKWFLVLCVALVGYLCYYLISSVPPEHTEYYIAHFEPFPNIIDDGKRSETTNKSDAFNLYDHRKFVEAIPKFNQSAPDKIDPLKWQFYKAVNLMAANEVEHAIPILETLTGNLNSSFNEAVEWYLYLAYIKQDEAVKARNIKSQMLSQPKHYKYSVLRLD